MEISSIFVLILTLPVQNVPCNARMTESVSKVKISLEKQESKDYIVDADIEFGRRVFSNFERGFMDL